MSTTITGRSEAHSTAYMESFWLESEAFSYS